MTGSINQKIDINFSKYPLRKYPKGQILVFADESPEHVYYIKSGKVVKYDVTYRGDEIILNVFKPPAFFPMSWAINRQGNKFFYKTEDETEVHIVPGDEALKFLSANPDVMLDLLSRIYRGSEGMLERMAQLMTGRAKSRLIIELIIECERFGIKLDSGGYLLKVNEQELASRAGLSRETVNRELKKIKSKKLVSIEKNHIVVNDPGSLKQLLD